MFLDEIIERIHQEQDAADLKEQQRGQSADEGRRVVALGRPQHDEQATAHA